MTTKGNSQLTLALIFTPNPLLYVGDIRFCNINSVSSEQLFQVRQPGSMMSMVRLFCESSVIFADCVSYIRR